MSRFDQPSEPDFDRYEPKPEDAQDALPDDVDLPEGFGTPEAVFVAPEAFQTSLESEDAHDVPCDCRWCRSEELNNPEMTEDEILYGSIDPAEHAAHAVLEALGTFRKAIAENMHFERAMAIRSMLSRVLAEGIKVADLAATKCDELIERRR